MKHAPMLNDILGQVESTRAVLKWQTGSGSSTLRSCGKLMRECAGRIIVSGMGASSFAALPLVQALEAQGLRTYFMESSELLHYGSGSFHSGDVAVLISRSGGSVEVMRLAEQMKQRGTRVIGVTNISGSPLASIADHTIEIGSLSDELIAVQTYTGTVLTLLLLAEHVAGRSGVERADECAAAIAEMNDLIQNSLAESEHWKSFLLGARPLYLLGRGSSVATLHGGSLLLNETAKSTSVAMTSGQFRHGPVEAVDSTFSAIVVGTSSRTRELDRKLASNLQRMGANVLWLGPAGKDSALRSMIPWDLHVCEALWPIFEIIPIQVAAYQLAWWKGIIPGDFRYASEVTQDESSFPLFEAKQG